MIRVNLLPFRAKRKKENIRRQVSIFLLTFIFAAIVLVYINIRLNHKTLKLQADLAKITAELADYKKITKEIKEIKEKLSLLKQKMTVISNLELNRKGPVRLLDTMTRMVIKNRMWFTKLGTKADTVTINGIAMDDKTVADFMVQLEGSTLFSSIDLITIKHEKIKESSNLKSFQITCNKIQPQNISLNKANGKAKK